MQLITQERVGKVVFLTLNRADRMNALSFPLLLELQAALDELIDDADARVLVLTGAGDKAFCAGADLKERLGMSELETRRYIRTIRETFVKVENFPRPTVAMINGLALGGGCELSLCCDLRFMSRSARIGLTETRLAIIPGAGGTQRLPRLIGKGRAKELIFTGRQLDAQAALDLGLVERVVEPEALRDACLALAEEMCLAGPLALIQAKFAIDRGLEIDLADGLALEGKAYEVLLPTLDRKEALEAFTQKRKPEFQGR